MGLVARAAFLVLQLFFVLLLQDGLLCNASYATILAPHVFAQRFAVQQVVVMSPRNVCCRHELDSLRRAICQAKEPKPGVTRLESHYAKLNHAGIRSHGCKGGV